MTTKCHSEPSLIYFTIQILRYAQYDVIFVILRAKTEESVQDFVTLNCLGFPVQKQVVRFTMLALTFVFATSGLRYRFALRQSASLRVLLLKCASVLFIFIIFTYPLFFLFFPMRLCRSKNIL